MRIVHQVTRSSSGLMVMAAVTALVVGISVGFHIFNEDTPPPWNPLGEYPIQRVTSRDVTTIDGPSVWLDSHVVVVALKCSTVPNVKVIGHSSWQRVDPLGRIFPTGRGTATRELGCSTVDYKNDIPAEVVESTLAVGGRATWRIVGEETPYKSNGERGVTRTWQTQNFVLVARAGR